MKRNWLGVVGLTTSVACGQNVLGPDEVLDGTYRYRGMTDNQLVLIEGEIVIAANAADGTGGTPFTGTWETAEVVFQQGLATGPQVGTGTIVGWVTDGELFAHMNPGVADNNVTLSGSLDGNRFQGRWEYATILGEVGSGRFSLDKIR